MHSPVDSDLERSLQEVLASLVDRRAAAEDPPQIDESVRAPLVALLDALPHAAGGLLAQAVAADPDAAPLTRRYALRLQAHAALLADAETLGVAGVDALLKRLSGTAGCYGFPTIAACAQRCRERLRREGALGEHLLRPVLDEIARL